MCWVAQHHLFRFYADCLRIMSAAENKRGGDRYQTSFKHRLVFCRVSPFSKRLRTMLQGYTPHHLVLPDNISTQAAQLNRKAVNIQ